MNKTYKFPSFSTISGTGPNSAIIHYNASVKSNRTLKRGDLYLVDSGGQYSFGTTDVTRTISLDNNSNFIREVYTRVLKGHIAVSDYKIRKNSKGSDIDRNARKPLKKVRLDYPHGTGHGVGYFLNVHEGPQSFSKNNKVNLKPGMIISNEPGYYKEGHFGIRIENLIYIKKNKFEELTMAPIEKNLIKKKMLNKREIKLPIALGKSISGNAIIGDLFSMPHLLIAGTTGSGKSVCINTIILSLLYKYTPEKCNLILIDPKMLELSTYEGIPHLLCPVITEARKATAALGWAVKEMENRYKLMTNVGVKNIDGYNSKHKKHMPYIVVIVDEMSDLMLIAGKEIENYIQRLSQMARAAGIHIIMATQRPSVDVITGTIKANFPTRISFQVSSKIDSRTILGEQGAEQLLGKGDMLFMSSANRIVRIHGPYVSESEIEKVNSFLRSQGKPDYIDEITVIKDSESISAKNIDNVKDELYDKAVDIIKTERKASTSFLQRKLQIGYNRAARIMEIMEKEGIVGQANHVGKRQIL